MASIKSLFPLIILCLSIFACSFSPKESKPVNSFNKAPVTNNDETFDLAKLTLKEPDVPGMVAERKVKTEYLTATDQTIIGFERLKISSAEILRYAGNDLSGINHTVKNNVLLHYNEKTKGLAFYEVRLYTEEQSAALLAALKKIGKPEFEKLGVSKGAIEIDEDGNEIKKASEEKQTFRVWENSKNGLTYYLVERGKGESYTLELTVLNRSENYAKQWISFRSLDWYK
ncbi:hypothetical protein [uncultured Mucilaginibacter sp.]|uniref:hypothetical protein n=1 Tax=uncultured Mucilaginibacter sp. TaxID=797541 RepID=UPI0025DC5D09|nr:hypothetical protein [uncultured Mucilaginibacter sp.]